MEWPKLGIGAFESTPLYKIAEAAFLRHRDRVTRVVGHSYGGAVAEALALRYPVRAVSYNGWESPFRARAPNVVRYGHSGDPVTHFGYLDQKTPGHGWVPHAYADQPAAQFWPSRSGERNVTAF